MFHSSSGGTGSGVFDLITKNFIHEKGLKFISITVMPSKEYSSLTVEPYNFVLWIDSLYENWNLSLWYDNQSLYRIWEKQLKIESPNFYDINELI